MTTKAQAAIEPEARDLADAVVQRTGMAQTIRLTAKYELDPAPGVTAKLDAGPLKITLRRPNQCYAIQTAGDQTREPAFDGKSLCVMHPALKFHALESLREGNMEQLADPMDKRLGFRPSLGKVRGRRGLLH